MNIKRGEFMLHPILQQYIPLTEFLSKVLGNDYAISLYDLSRPTPSLVTCSPQAGKISDSVIKRLVDKSTDCEDVIINENILSAPNHCISVSCMPICQNDMLLGMLCITFDDVHYRNICHQIFQLCRPNSNSVVNLSITPTSEPTEQKNSVHTELVARDAAIEALHTYGVCASRLSSEERLEIIQSLDEAGIFLLKGAVKDVATVLECSSASVYRYLSQIRMDALSI